MGYSLSIAVASALATGVALTAPFPPSHRRTAQTVEFVESNIRSAMEVVKELGRKSVKLGYTCREIGDPLDRCMKEFDDVFDKAMAGEPI